MSVDWLTVWGVASATAPVFKPILDELAKTVGKDIAKSYVKECFSSVFSVFHQKPLAKATGLAIKSLLELIEDELLDADLSRDQVADRTDDVQRFLEQAEIAGAIGSLFLDADYYLDPSLLAKAWQRIESGDLPDKFSWERIAKRFTRNVRDIRGSSGDLKDTFESLSNQRNSDALQELQGLPAKFDIETYREALLERFGNLDFASLETTGAYYNAVRLWSVFVPQSVRECHEYDPQLLEVPKEHLERLAEKGESDSEELAESEKLQDERRQAYVNQPTRPVLSMMDDQSLVRQVVLGDPGSGKSSLLRFLALRWARIEDANLRYTQPLPLLIDLREYNRWECTGGKNFPKFLHEASTWHQLNQQTLKHLLEQPDRVSLMLDGLDEIFDPAERKQVVNDIHRFSNDYKHVRIVVTSRVVGYQPFRLKNTNFNHFMLQDLDTDQIDSFLDKWHQVTFDKPEEAEPKRQRLSTAIKNSNSIAQLAGNPLLLTMMAILNRNQKLPDDRVELYQQSARLLLHQWDIERTLGEFPGTTTEIGLREKTEILRLVAYAMQTRMSDNSRANYIDGQALTSLIEEYLHTELRFDKARAVARAMVEQLRARNFILCYLGADSYSFVHRTFLEYFCAAEIVHRFNVAKTLSEQGLIDIFDAHCHDDDWREVLRLICGQIDEQFVGRIVEHLATWTDLEKGDGKTPLPELPLAIWCLSEVRGTTKLEGPAALLLKRLLVVFDHGRHPTDVTIVNFMRDDIVSACQRLGSRWPKQNELRTCAITRIDEITADARRVWPEFLAAVTNDRKLIVELSSRNCQLIRSSVIRTLANKWPDEKTRILIETMAIEDDHEDARGSAIQALASKWTGEKTRTIFKARATDDTHAYVRGTAFWAMGKTHSDFGKCLSTKDRDGLPPYLDPLQPVSREHIESAAKNSNVPTEEIDTRVKDLSDYLGWDITLGAKQE